MYLEVATSTPDIESETASEIGRGGWARVRRDSASENVYIWNESGDGFVVINEVIA